MSCAWSLVLIIWVNVLIVAVLILSSKISSGLPITFTFVLIFGQQKDISRLSRCVLQRRQRTCCVVYTSIQTWEWLANAEFAQKLYIYTATCVLLTRNSLSSNGPEPFPYSKHILYVLGAHDQYVWQCQAKLYIRILEVIIGAFDYCRFST